MILLLFSWFSLFLSLDNLRYLKLSKLRFAKSGVLRYKISNTKNLYITICYFILFFLLLFVLFFFLRVLNMNNLFDLKLAQSGINNFLVTHSTLEVSLSLIIICVSFLIYIMLIKKAYSFLCFQLGKLHILLLSKKTFVNKLLGDDHVYYAKLYKFALSRVHFRFMKLLDYSAFFLNITSQNPKIPRSTFEPNTWDKIYFSLSRITFEIAFFL